MLWGRDGMTLHYSGTFMIGYSNHSSPFYKAMVGRCIKILRIIYIEN